MQHILFSQLGEGITINQQREEQVKRICLESDFVENQAAHKLVYYLQTQIIREENQLVLTKQLLEILRLVSAA